MRKQQRSWVAGAFAIVTLTCALARADGAALSIPDVAARGAAFGPGEQATYKVHYLGMTAATALITVGSETQQWGTEVWPIVAMVRTESMFAMYPVKDKFITYWDAAKSRSIGSDLFADENRKRRRERVKLNHESRAANVTRQKEGEGEKERTVAIPPGAADVAAAAFSIRNAPLEVGRTFQMPIFTGVKTFTMQAKVEEKRIEPTPFGKREVFKVRIQTDFSGKFAAKRDMFAYFTTDPAHILVRVEADFLLGTVEAELVEYKGGRQLAAKGTGGGG
jgi:hypothetical protein